MQCVFIYVYVEFKGKKGRRVRYMRKEEFGGRNYKRKISEEENREVRMCVCL